VHEARAAGNLQLLKIESLLNLQGIFWDDGCKILFIYLPSQATQGQSTMNQPEGCTHVGYEAKAKASRLGDWA
jgi:hypothetical protein